MAYFPEISALDFSLVTDPESGSLTQSPIPLLEFEFQHTSNFDYYKPCPLDFYFLDSPINRYAVLRSDLASCYWETLKMKCRYILAAATGWNSESDCALPTTVPEAKLHEIGMTAPPFPLIHQLTYNFLLLPERPEKICEWIRLWQANSLQLAAWIAQAKVQSKRLPSCSWVWPVTPNLSYSTSTSPDSPDAIHLKTTKSEEGATDHDDSTIAGNQELLFGECPEPPSKCGTLNSRPTVISTTSLLQDELLVPSTLTLKRIPSNELGTAPPLIHFVTEKMPTRNNSSCGNLLSDGLERCERPCLVVR